MSNPKLEIYKMLKEKGLVRNPNLEYEEMIREDLMHQKHLRWVNSLSPKEQKDFNVAFNN